MFEDEEEVAVEPSDELMHYGVKRRSGRYPWGSGENPYQHSGDFMARVDELKSQGLSETEIARAMKMSTTDYRTQLRVANHERREVKRKQARSMRDDGKSLNEIARALGYPNESSVRSLLDSNTAENKNRAAKTADILEEELKKKGAIDVGAGVEKILGCSSGTLSEAVFILNTRGYDLDGIGVPQVTMKGKQTNVSVLHDPEIELAQFYKDPSLIKSVGDFCSDDGGTTYRKLEYPASIDSKRVEICYGDQGGRLKDGVIELRRGVPDLDLGASHYAQVRILVDGTHYLKGMAMYADDLPDGVDIRFNTNKESGTPKQDVFKKIKDDPDNPFGASIKANGQSYYTGTDGKEHLSAINKLKEEGDWESMSKNLSSQFLSKQPIAFIRKQLDLTYADYESQYEEICSLTNPTVKQKMLLDFAEGCDAAAQHMKAAALPRQTTQVILPLGKIKENEVYAPNYRNGEQLALIRYPHAGTFEIPVVTVNNRDPSGMANIGPNVRDAIGIHPKVAERLSGADFDGDQVVAIPTNNGRVKIQTTKRLEGLEGFDPKDAYPHVEGARIMNKGADTQRQMGVVSNLITDMTLRGATPDELARAVRHSMVVIDANKHKLNYRQSELDNNIAGLKLKYQGYTDPGTGKDKGGASTLLSRRKQDYAVPERKGAPQIDPKTGKVSYKETGATYVDPKTSETVRRMVKSTLIRETEDLRTLSSGTPQENAYADYGNKMKALANRARKEMVATPNLQYSKEAKARYQLEVDSLNAKLNTFLKNAPRERQAQALANSEIKAKKQANPEMTKEDERKLRNTAIVNARATVGASSKDVRIQITDKEWEAIQAGAVTHTKLAEILKHADADRVRELATPKAVSQLSDAKVSKLQAMARSGNYTNKEIADALGCSPSTVSRYMSVA